MFTTFFKSTTKKMMCGIAVFTLVLGMFSGTLAIKSYADPIPPSEPSCQTASTTPAFNGFPTAFDREDPDYLAGNCKDIPLLSFWPVDTQNSNPREKTLTQGGSNPFSFQIYYNNSAKPDATGNPKITNPIVKTDFVKVSNTQYKLTATIVSDNAPTITSSQKGGDLIINVPAGTVFSIQGNNTFHYIDAVKRDYEVKNSQRAFPYDRINDNSVGSTVSNPIFTSFNGQTLASNTGFKIKDSLNAGFLGYGYILSSIDVIVPNTVEVPNQPPVLPDQTITVVRGQSGSFQQLNGTDPEPNYPLTYDFSQMPSACRITSASTGANTSVVIGSTGAVITCQTTKDYPTTDRFTFPITPIDALNARGKAGNFTVIVTEPVPDNKPPVLPGQEITVTRGKTATFVQLPGSDPDSNYPLTYDYSKLPSNCKVITLGTIANTSVVSGSTGPVIACETKDVPLNINKITFPIIPIDGKNLPGTPGTFIVNIVDPVNLPPSLPGQEITVIRGETGKFNPLNGTDPEPDYPLTYDTSAMPSYATITTPGNGANTTVVSGSAGPTISVATTKDTPKENRISFLIYPIDAKGTKGTPGNFIVNIIEPKLDAKKECFVKGSTTACNSVSMKPGDEVTYKITATNSGTAPAKNVKISDTYDKVRLQDVKDISDNGVHSTATGKIDWTLGDLAINQSKFVTFGAKIADTVKDGDKIENVAIVTADNVPPVIVKVEFPVIKPQLLLSKECFVKATTTPCNTANLSAGSEVSYKITTKNLNANVIKNVRLFDSFDKTKLTDITNIQPTGTYDPATGTINWTLGDLNGNESKSVTFDAKVSATAKNGEIIVNTVTVKADNIPDQTVKVEFPVKNPILEVLKECFEKVSLISCDKTPMRPDSKLVYRITVSNKGEGVAKNAKLVDTYDATRITNISNISNDGKDDAKSITWMLGDMNGNTSKKVSFEATVSKAAKAGDKVINIAVASADNHPPVTGKVDFPIAGDPILTTSQKVCYKPGTSLQCKDAQIKRGDTVEYVIIVKNTGESSAKNVIVTDTYDRAKIGNITNINPSGTLDSVNATITWNAAELTPGQSLTLKFQAQVLESVLDGDNVANIAIIKADDVPPVTVRADFPVNVPKVFKPEGTPRTGGAEVAFGIFAVTVLGGAFYFYRKYKLQQAGFTPGRNEEM
jgi:hypothetical protein